MQQGSDQLVTADEVRFIRLGAQNRWAKRAFEAGELLFGATPLPFDLACSGDTKAMRKFLIDAGYPPRKAGSAAAETAAFFTLSEETLWFTFFEEKLWWCFARQPVRELDEARGPRFARELRRPWSSTDLHGRTLSTRELPGKITMTARYAATICRSAGCAELVAAINGLQSPLAGRQQALSAEMTDVVAEASRRLTPSALETLTDLLLSRSGYIRESRVGGNQPGLDIECCHPLTGERLYVQVKSQLDQAVLDGVVEAYRAEGRHDRLLVVSHSDLDLTQRTEGSDVIYLAGRNLAAAVVRTGLTGWLMGQVR